MHILLIKQKVEIQKSFSIHTLYISAYTKILLKVFDNIEIALL